jgi:Icc-related predicted phosphoesterase
MKILGVSDIHGATSALAAIGSYGLAEQVDLVLIAGDICVNRRYCGFIELLPVLADQLQCPIILTPGNHDYFSPNRFPYKHIVTGTDVVTLIEQQCQFQDVNIYGSPYTQRTPVNANWEWNWSKDYLDWDIPVDTNILLTHCPPYGYGDLTLTNQRVGSETLTQQLDRLPKLRAHLYGHIHEEYGYRYRYGQNCLLANVSCCDTHCNLQPNGIVIFTL